MLIRPASLSDLPAMLSMYDHSRSLMRADGNQVQWVGYPTVADASADIASGSALIISCHRHASGTFALVDGIEPTYRHIDHGRWIDADSAYATVHRIAKTPRSHGIARTALAYAKSRFPHLRIDTHETNRPMRHIIQAEGFVYCGTVYMDDGSPRLAYEWWRWPEVDSGLQHYVERYVLPLYDRFDAAHRRDHVRRVIARSMVFYRQLLRDPSISVPFSANCFYAAAALHDIGLAEGRATHHSASARLVRQNRTLPRWFRADELDAIAEAAEDHRASAPQPPRSLLGCVVAEADRDIEPETIVRRTVAYGLDHFPFADRESQWQRTLEHLHEKYDTGGYLKLWHPQSPNTAPLAELRDLIHDPDRLRVLFDHFFDSSQTPVSCLQS